VGTFEGGNANPVKDRHCLRSLLGGEFAILGRAFRAGIVVGLANATPRELIQIVVEVLMADRSLVGSN
jgi:hypothetical protein